MNTKMIYKLQGEQQGLHIQKPFITWCPFSKGCKSKSRKKTLIKARVIRYDSMRLLRLTIINWHYSLTSFNWKFLNCPQLYAMKHWYSKMDAVSVYMYPILIRFDTPSIHVERVSNTSFLKKKKKNSRSRSDTLKWGLWYV